MHIFFTVLGWILVTLIALIILFLILPIYVSIKLDYDKLTVRLHILFISLTLYPAKPPRQKKKRPKEGKEKQEDKPNPTKKLAKSLSLDKILGLISTANGAMRIVLKWLFIRHIEVVYPVHKDDPADTGIAYGQMQAYVGAAIATLRNAMHLSFKKLDLIPDFTGEYKYMRYFYCNIWATPLIMLIAAIYAIKRLLTEKLL